MHTIYICVLLALTVALGSGFIMGTHQGWKKCYSSDVSPDKTLDVRFGFPRREKENCLFRLQIDFMIDSATRRERKVLHEGQYRCFDMSPREPFVYKHNTLQEEFSGLYRICVENMEDKNLHNNTMFELQISQKFDPSLYAELHNPDIPLVESAELMEVESLIMAIRRTLSWCQVYVKEAEEKGDELERLLIDSEALGKKITLIQMAFLVVYGVFWILAVRSLYQKH